MQRVLDAARPEDELEMILYLDPSGPRPQGFPVPKLPKPWRELLPEILAAVTPADPTAYCSHRFVDVQAGRLRRRALFRSDGSKERTEWIEKTHRTQAYRETNDFGGWSLRASEERVVPEQRMERSERTTVGYRRSVYDFVPGWDLDITATREIKVVEAEEAKRKLTDIADNPLRDANWWSYWRFELERNDATMPPPDLWDVYERLLPGVPWRALRTVRDAAAACEHPEAIAFARPALRNGIQRLFTKAVEPTLDDWIRDHQHELITPGADGRACMVARHKIDGVRELVWLRPADTDAGRAVGELLAVGAKYERWEEPEVTEEYMFDAEFKDGVWWILQPLIWRGDLVTHLRNSERAQIMQEEGLPLGDEFRICPTETITHPAEQLARMARPGDAASDGIIIATDAAYFEQSTWKWKPDGTCDFLAVRAPDWLVGKAPFLRHDDSHTLYFLNVGCPASRADKNIGFSLWRYLELPKNASYIYHPFSPPDMPLAYIWSSPRSDLHGHIVEMNPCGHLPGPVTWSFRRIREDKQSVLRGGGDMGNDIRTVLDIWSKVSCPFPIESLWTPPQERSDPFAGIRDSLAGTLADMLLEEPATQPPVYHMIPWALTERAVFVYPAGCATSGLAPYIPDSTTARRHTCVAYPTIGKVELPRSHAGGAPVLVTMDPEILNHAILIGHMVAPGGRLVTVVNTAAENRVHPPVDLATLTREFERAGCMQIADIGAPIENDLFGEAEFGSWTVILWRRENKGATTTTTVEVQRENPHLTARPDANYHYKYSRQKTKDLTGTIADIPRNPAHSSSLPQCPELGTLLVDAEYLSTLPADAQVVYVGSERLAAATLFPGIRWVDPEAADAQESAEYILAHDPSRGRAAITRYQPHAGMIDIDSASVAAEKIPRGRMFLYPYDDPSSSRAAIMFVEPQGVWTLSSEIWANEMRGFHTIYRASAFRYANHMPGLDSCYCCRTQQLILTKIARVRRCTPEAARAAVLGALCTAHPDREAVYRGYLA